MKKNVTTPTIVARVEQVLDALRQSANGTGVARMTWPEIAEATRLTIAQARYCVGMLIEAGRVERRGNGRLRIIEQDGEK